MDFSKKWLGSDKISQVYRATQSHDGMAMTIYSTAVHHKTVGYNKHAVRIYIRTISLDT